MTASADPARPDLRAAALSPEARRLSPRYLDEHCLLPAGLEPDGALAIIVGAPLPDAVREELERLYDRPLRATEAPAAEIRAAILAARRDPESTRRSGAVSASDVEQLDSRSLASEASSAPILSLVNVLLLDALRMGASDVHLEPTADGLRVRYRLDGLLHDVSHLALSHRAAVTSRVKLMAGLDIAERRLPQDGRSRVKLGDREVDLRVATLPALHGEGIVIRILDDAGGARDLGALGMPADTRSRFERLLRARTGLVLVTGPTGSGKTTTLYGALRPLNAPGVKVVTVEDPVEYRVDGVIQVPINRRAGLDFATALRALLRHDPDVVMVGELRDRETAEIAVQAALTGHLVLATLHTNDAVSAVTRLVDMGIEPYLVAATVQGILAQRLVRMVCQSCTRSGCDACAQSGYRGRTGLFELYVPGEADRELIVRRASFAALLSAARAGGLVTLRQHGETLAADGVTSLEEVLRVAGSDDVTA